MSENNSRDTDFEVERLTEGLKTCRAMVADYRAMLGGDRDEQGGSGQEHEPIRLEHEHEQRRRKQRQPV